MSNACNVGSPLCYSIADCEVKIAVGDEFPD